MFYSETLLAKTGPLARVWLAANLERKLTKQNVLSSNLENNVKDIIGQGQAPMALRLSGQLLLGVAKIYGRKVKYLVDDAQEALTKIKIVSGYIWLKARLRTRSTDRTTGVSTRKRIDRSSTPPTPRKQPQRAHPSRRSH